MKLIIVSVAILISAFSCQKEEVRIGEGHCFPVSIVADKCGEVVLQIEDPQFNHLGETWLEHQNVFFTDFGCRDISGLRGEIFYIVMLSEPLRSNGCVRCMATLAYSGEKRYHVNLVDACE